VVVAAAARSTPFRVAVEVVVQVAVAALGGAAVKVVVGASRWLFSIRKSTSSLVSFTARLLEMAALALQVNPVKHCLAFTVTASAQAVPVEVAVAVRRAAPVLAVPAESPSVSSGKVQRLR
jgi:hypothetical protein